MAQYAMLPNIGGKRDHLLRRQAGDARQDSDPLIDGRMEKKLGVVSR
jgi:hypothetical protein